MSVNLELNPQELLKLAKDFSKTDAYLNCINATTESIRKITSPPTSPYKPKEQTIARLEEPFEDAGHLFSYISPFNLPTGRNIKDVIIIIKKFHQFTDGNIERMTEDTKQEIIKHAAEGWRKSFQIYKNGFIRFPHQIFDEDEYNRQRLKYFCQYEKEPTLISKEDYIYIEGHIISFISDVTKLYLRTEDSQENNKKLTDTDVDELFVDFQEMMMRKFSQNHHSSSVCNKWILRLQMTNTTLSHQEIVNYRKMVICPISEKLEKLEFRTHEIKCNILANLCPYVNKLEQLLEEKNFIHFLSRIISICQDHATNNNKEPKGTLYEKNARFVMKTLPEVICALERKTKN